MKLSAGLLREMYAVLRDQPPFNKWKLPAPNEVRFGARMRIKSENYDPATAKLVVGQYRRLKDFSEHEIRVSAAKHPTLNDAFTTMAHEMVHLACAIDAQRGRLSEKAAIGHGVEFKRRAAQVCKQFGFDPETF